MAEAPRGTLMHHYRVDDDGLIGWVNLVIATGHNNLAMNRGVLEVARRYVDGQQLDGGHAQPRRGGDPVLRPVPPSLPAFFFFGPRRRVRQRRSAATMPGLRR